MKSHLKLLGILFTATLILPLSVPLFEVRVNQNVAFTRAAIDTSRVDWKTDLFPNPGFESWYDDTSPEGISSGFTTEHYAYYESDPTYVNEGARSFVLQARALNPIDYSEAVLRRSSWSSWNNPTNLTLKFDWFIDELPSAIDSNYLRLRVRFAAPGERNLYYYFESQDTVLTNSTNNCYFQILGPMQTWNIFDRNMTEDYFEAFDTYPTYQFYTFEIQLLSRTTAYCRAYFDDVWLVNGTTFIGGSVSNGNFESNSIWQTSLNNDPALISKSTTRQEGEFSLNATVMSNGNISYAQFGTYNNIRASSLNPDRLSFQWRIDEVVSASVNTYAYLRVYCRNGTEDVEFYLTYALFYMGNSIPYQTYGGQELTANGFNVTNQWHTFDRSIWSDVSSVNTTDFIIIDDIEVEVYSRDPGARITILFDDISHVTSALSDMGYEDQQHLGDEIWTWNLGDNPAPNYTVTDVAYSGSRAARLALADGEYFEGQQYLEQYQINDNTDVWLDLFWRIEDWSEDASNLLYIEVYFEEESLAYILANSSAVPTGNGFDAFILVPGYNSHGVWTNLQRNIFNDYHSVFGVEPNTILYSIILHGEADFGGQIEVLFDDIYLYNDPAPEIESIFFTPTIVDTDVNVSAQVYDPSLASVTLHYQIGTGAWNEVAMIDTGAGFNATIPGQSIGTHVELYVEAVDTFGQISQSTQVGYTVTDIDVPPPIDLLPLLVAVTVITVAGVIIVVYIFVIKPKQQVG